MSAKNWIEFPRTEGETSHQAHADLPGGTFEREMGRDGFFGPATHFYHRHAPTGWIAVEGNLRPRAFDAAQAAVGAIGPFRAAVLLAAESCLVMICTIPVPTNLLRNSDGDLLLFIHEGEGDLFCDFGHLSWRDGDYILIPRGTMWRLEPRLQSVVLMIEARGGAFRLSDRGILGPHAVFDPAVLETPKIDEAFKAQADGRCTVYVKRRNVVSTIIYPFNPLDAVGWKGNLAPVRLNWRDIRPVMSHRYHLPPSVHSTFVADRFIVCTFVPRPLETDPGALKVPFFHSNEEYDEAIFYHRGQFFSRDNIHPGMMTMHPNGITHGPHPKAFAAGAAAARKETDEVAVMIDSRDPFELGQAAEANEVPDYAESWTDRADTQAEAAAGK
ncbi:MAG TPA: homogentisate 1,2-dioxygenase [Rhizomicrobium sp.]|jgi:homogentisate 1,2-dioxygenase|nr:homogentisate 1,2-dioxygenase [Rhizomicrobium sp.]